MNENKNFSLSAYVIENCDIVEVIKSFINLQKKGVNYWGLCPFHGDKNPSLCVSPSKKIFKCFTCNAKGNVISFVKQIKNIQFFDAIKEIIKILNIQDENILNSLTNAQSNFSPLYEIDKLNNEAINFYHRMLLSKKGLECFNYLKNRGIDESIIEKYQLGYAPKSDDKKFLFSLLTNEDEILGKDRDPSLVFTPLKLVDNGLAILTEDGKYNDFFWDRLMIPIKNEHGLTVGFSGRSLKKDEKIKYINTKTTAFFKKEDILFNFNNFDKQDYMNLYVVEGYMDVFAMVRMGINNVIASMGTAFTDKQIQLIKRYETIKNIILCFDNDNAGRNATKETAEKFIRNGFTVYVVNPYNKQFKDVDELLKGLGKELAMQTIAKQITFIEYEAKQRLTNLVDRPSVISQTKELVDMINEFAYNPLTIEDELTCISTLANIPKDNIKQMIHPNYQMKTKNNQTSNNNKSNRKRSYTNNFNSQKEYVNNFHDKYEMETEKKIYDYSNLKVFNDNKLVVLETELFKILPTNAAVRDLYLEWIGTVVYNKGVSGKILKCIDGWIKFLIRENREVSYNNLINTIVTREGIQEYKVLAIDFLKKAKADVESAKMEYSELLDQGVKIVKEIYTRNTEKLKLNNTMRFKDTNLDLAKEKNREIDIKLDVFNKKVNAILKNSLN